MASTILIIVIAVLAFAPMIIACHRQHNSAAAILICNLIGLFTGIFWLVAIVWCFTDNTKKDS